MPDTLGERIQRELVGLVESKAVKAVVGQIVKFDDVPAAVEAMANRETVGRTIVKLY